MNIEIKKYHVLKYGEMEKQGWVNSDQSILLTHNGTAHVGQRWNGCYN